LRPSGPSRGRHGRPNVQPRAAIQRRNAKIRSHRLVRKLCGVRRHDARGLLKSFASADWRAAGAAGPSGASTGKSEAVFDMVLPPKKDAISAADERKSRFPRNCTLAEENLKDPRRQLSPRSDHLGQVARSALMGRVRRAGTAPELKVRSAAHNLGFRFRVDRSDLPGRPDIVFPRHRAVIFVHGCFWHRHTKCDRASIPKTRTDYWMAKFARNTARDARVQRELKAAGWRVLVLWECEINDTQRLSAHLKRFFSRQRSNPA
jgi:DNA mismatch endonuclease, patch repair protein